MPELECWHRINKWKKTIPVNVPIHAAVMETAGHARNIIAKTAQEQIAEKKILTEKQKKAASQGL